MARKLYGAFRILDADTALQAAPLQITRRAAETDVAILTERNPELTYALLEAHLKEPKS